MKADILTSGSDTDYGTEEFRLPSFSGRWPHSTGSITTCRNPQASQGFGDFFLPRFGIRPNSQRQASCVNPVELRWKPSDHRMDRWRQTPRGLFKRLLGAHQHAPLSQVSHLQEACAAEERQATTRGEAKWITDYGAVGRVGLQLRANRKHVPSRSCRSVKHSDMERSSLSQVPPSHSIATARMGNKWRTDAGVRGLTRPPWTVTQDTLTPSQAWLYRVTASLYARTRPGGGHSVSR